MAKLTFSQRFHRESESASVLETNGVIPMKNILLTGGAIAALAYGSCAMAAAPPTLSGNPGQTTPSLLITIGSGGGATVSNTFTCGSTSGCPYDDSEDTYIGVVNNSSSVVSSLNLTAAVGTHIFGFDGDGIDTYGAGSNTQDTSGYGGADAFFTNINAGQNTGTVNFIGGIAANGGQGYFSLEEPVAAATFTGGGGGITTGGVPEPASWALMILGFFGMGSLLRHRRQDAVAHA